MYRQSPPAARRSSSGVVVVIIPLNGGHELCYNDTRRSESNWYRNNRNDSIKRLDSLTFTRDRRAINTSSYVTWIRKNPWCSAHNRCTRWFFNRTRPVFNPVCDARVLESFRVWFKNNIRTTIFYENTMFSLFFYQRDFLSFLFIYFFANGNHQL